MTIFTSIINNIVIIIIIVTIKTMSNSSTRLFLISLILAIVERGLWTVGHVHELLSCISELIVVFNEDVGLLASFSFQYFSWWSDFFKSFACQSSSETQGLWLDFKSGRMSLWLETTHSPWVSIDGFSVWLSLLLITIAITFVTIVIIKIVNIIFCNARFTRLLHTGCPRDLLDWITNDMPH